MAGAPLTGAAGWRYTPGMEGTVLHVVDETTPADLFEMLARGLGCGDNGGGPAGRQHIVALGHRSSAEVARAAGIAGAASPAGFAGGDAPAMRFIHSMGWADPTGWRGMKREIARVKPECVHAWGITGAVAAAQALSARRAAANGTTARVVSLADLPPLAHLRLLPMIHKGTVTGFGRPAPACTWRVTTHWLKRELHGNGIAADAVSVVRPPVPHDRAPSAQETAVMRQELGLAPGDGPVILLGGDGGSGRFLAGPGIDPLAHGGRGGPRHDLGMWTGAILRQIFPNIRIIVREDARGRPDPGFERLFEHLPDDQIVVPAPARYGWRELLAVADVMLVTPDGPLAGGCMLHAFAAGVPVIGTPVEAVKEWVSDGVNGMLAASTRPREIAAAVEAFFAGGEALRRKLAEGGRKRWGG